MLGKFLRGLTRVSPAKVYELLTNPWIISFMLTRPPISPSATSAAQALFPDIEPAQIEAYLLELLRNDEFFTQLNSQFVEKRRRRINCDGWYPLLYLIVRCAKPTVMVETGVFDGSSSAIILQAMLDNAKGTLISIDLPAVDTISMSTHCMDETTLPPGCQPGWVVPDYLRERQRLILGDSKKLLPATLSEHSEIDIFFHDSLHTYEHQTFEYNCAWPKIGIGGLLLSDDIYWNRAFHSFCRKLGKKYVHINGFGATRK